MRWDPMGNVCCQTFIEILSQCARAGSSSEGNWHWLGGQATWVPFLLPVALAMGDRHLLCSMLGFTLLPVTTSLQLFLSAGGGPYPSTAGDCGGWG